MEDKQLVILAAGKGSRLYPLTFGFPKILLSFIQKPAIYNMLIPLINKGLKDITIIVNKENKDIIKKFNDYLFQNISLDIKYIIQEEMSGPGAAFALSANFINKPTILLLSDTICSIPEKFEYSFVASKKINSNETYKYCMIESSNSIITDLIDKPLNSKLEEAVIGLYYFKNYKLLKDILVKENCQVKSNYEYQLSSIIKKYMLKEKVYIMEVEEWIDIGNLNDYAKANKNKFNCRNFNTLKVENDVLYKKSNYKKIVSEFKWYYSIKNTLFEKYSPKFYKDCAKNNMYGIEYYDYLTLSEYFVYYPLGENNQDYIFEELVTLLLNIYKETKVHKNTQEFNLLFYNLLKKKTIERIKEWERQDLVNEETIIINNCKLVGLYQCLEKLEDSIQKICNLSNKYISIIHGDPSFSNILFSPRTMIFKFIDPRGNFFKDTIYGDYRYDIAKLRHCYHGRYDDIINNLFKIEENNKSISFQFFKNQKSDHLDNILKTNKIDIDDIELIEALLFISMIPLHSDFPNRQLIYFAQGIIMLNNQLNRRNLV